MSRKHTYNEVKNFFKDYGCVLIEKEYKDNKKLMKYVCICGNEAFISLHSLLQGRKCFSCSGKKKHTIEEMQKAFELKDCKLLTKEYKNAFQKLQYICKCGTNTSICWNRFQQGQTSCPKCISKMSKKETHWKWNPDREALKTKKKIANKIRWALRWVLTQCGTKKLSKTHEILGYSFQQLFEHLSKFPNWEKLSKQEEWHLDHVFPISAFLKHGIIDPKIINCLENLQPLSKQDNFSKADKYNKEDFQKFVQSHLLLDDPTPNFEL